MDLGIKIPTPTEIGGQYNEYAVQLARQETNRVVSAMRTQQVSATYQIICLTEDRNVRDMVAAAMRSAGWIAAVHSDYWKITAAPPTPAVPGKGPYR